MQKVCKKCKKKKKNVKKIESVYSSLNYCLATDLLIPRFVFCLEKISGKKLVTFCMHVDANFRKNILSVTFLSFCKSGFLHRFTKLGPIRTTQHVQFRHSCQQNLSSSFLLISETWTCSFFSEYSSRKLSDIYRDKAIFNIHLQ